MNKTTASNAHDVNIGNDLLHGDEKSGYGDSGYLGIEKHRNALSAKKYHIVECLSQIQSLPNKYSQNSVKL